MDSKLIDSAGFSTRRASQAAPERPVVTIGEAARRDATTVNAGSSGATITTVEKPGGLGTNISKSQKSLKFYCGGREFAVRVFNRMRSLTLAGGLTAAAILIVGCTKTEHRLNADRDAYCTIAERNSDPRWAASKYSIDLDPRSRYFDNFDPDYSPMPVDDPASQQYMHFVDGKKGWKHWHDNGVRSSLDNANWRTQLGQYAELTEDGLIRLDTDSSLRLAYMHSPLHQRQLETLYLTSLDVTGERFRLNTRFFGGTNKTWAHLGKLGPAGIVFNPFTNDYVVTQAANGAESNRFGLTTDAQARKRFAAAGEVLVGFANSFVFEFAGGDVSLASSLANFSFVQPLLRGAGRDVALEQLTQAERQLLANLRAYGQFRQGLFTQVVIGELGVTGPQRGTGSTSLQSFSGVGGVNGYLGLLQQAQQIRNTEDNLRLQLRTRDRLEALYDNDIIDIVQLDQFRQNIEVTRANRLDQTNALKLAVDNFLTGTLGLPADVPVQVDESLVQQFQLIPPESNPVLESLLELQKRVGDVGELIALAFRIQELDADLPQLANQQLEDAETALDKLSGLVKTVGRRLEKLPQDISLMQQVAPDYTDSLAESDQAAVRSIVSRARQDSEELRRQFEGYSEDLEKLLDKLDDDKLQRLLQERPDWLTEMFLLSRGVVLVQWVSREVSSEPERIIEMAADSVQPVRQLIEAAEQDLARMEEAALDRERSMRDDDEKKTFRRDRERLHQRLQELKSGEVSFDVAVAELEGLRNGFESESRAFTVRGLTAWIQTYLQVAERLTLVPAQARLEVITVEDIELDPELAFQIALINRLDFMNGRAALVDRWRAIQVAADALQSDFTITGGGEVRTARNNPVDFRAATSSLRLGLEFDAPLARLLERNGYRETLIEYQRSRRSLIQSHDALQKGLRALLRTLEQRRLQLEIQRRAVSIALRRVDQTQLALLTPPPQGQPGVRPQINPTTAINLLGAQASLQTSQNSFLAAWLNYYAARVRLYRELGVMQLDPSGKWIENSVEFKSDDDDSIPLIGDPLPPEVPIELPEAPPNAKHSPDSLVRTVSAVNLARQRPDAGDMPFNTGVNTFDPAAASKRRTAREQDAELLELKRRRKQLKIERLKAELRTLE